MKKFLLILLLLPFAAGAQGNKYEDVVPVKFGVGNGCAIRAKVAGVEQTFLVDPMKTTSVTRDGAVLQRLEISPNHFVPSLKTVKGDVPDGATAILGRDAFRQSVLTIFPFKTTELYDDFGGEQSIESRESWIMLSSPYKPEWMPLKSRRDIAADMAPIDTMVVSFDFARGKYYSIHVNDMLDVLNELNPKIPVLTPETAPAGEIEHLTTLDFLSKVANIRNGEEWKYLGDTPCVLDFWAEWCAPCKRMNPAVEALAREYAGRVRVYKINIDEEPELKAYFKAVAIPMFVFVPMNGAPRPVMGSSVDIVRTEMEKLLK